MEYTQVSSEDVKKYFLLANAGKNLFGSENDLSKIGEMYKRVSDEIFNLDVEELNRRITDKTRLARYDSFDWFRGQIPLKDIGPWPKMSGLDLRLTTGNITETARDIEAIRNGEIILPYKDKAERGKKEDALSEFLKKSNSIRENLDFVYERFPIILFPGGEVREKDYNKWARENSVPLCNIFEHDLDDGNIRAVSYSLEGIDQTPCFYSRDIE